MFVRANSWLLVFEVLKIAQTLLKPSENPPCSNGAAPNVATNSSECDGPKVGAVCASAPSTVRLPPATGAPPPAPPPCDSHVELVQPPGRSAPSNPVPTVGSSVMSGE